MQLELNEKQTTKRVGFKHLEFKKSPVILNHYTFKPKTDNIKNAVAGEYTQKSFKRLFWDRPSYTACYGNNEVHIHPELDRRLTVREAARIQDFPDFWIFLGGLTSEFKQIGNAVPSSLGYGVVKTVLEHVSVENKNAISLFTGIGGLDIGAESAGLNIKAALEIDEYCIRGLQLNKEIGKRTGIHSFLSHTAIIQADLSKKINTTKEFIEGQAKSKIGKIEFVIGGPPCQAFSSAGSRKGLDDDRGLLYLGYLNILRAFTPHTFIFENVIGLKRMEGGKILEKISKDFLKLGYNLRVVHLNSVNFGVPQFRDRIFVIGTFDDQFTLDRIERKLLSIKTEQRVVKDVLSGLPLARMSPKKHDYDIQYASSNGKWDLGDAVYSENQPALSF